MADYHDAKAANGRCVEYRHNATAARNRIHFCRVVSRLSCACPVSGGCSGLITSLQASTPAVRNLAFWGAAQFVSADINTSLAVIAWRCFGYERCGVTLIGGRKSQFSR